MFLNRRWEKKLLCGCLFMHLQAVTFRHVAPPALIIRTSRRSARRGKAPAVIRACTDKHTFIYFVSKRSDGSQK